MCKGSQQGGTIEANISAAILNRPWVVGSVVDLQTPGLESSSGAEGSSAKGPPNLSFRTYKERKEKHSDLCWRSSVSPNLILNPNLAFTRYCYCQYCMVYGIHKGGAGGASYIAQ